MWKALDQIEARLAFVACIITPGFCILGTALRFLDAIKSRRRINCEDWCALGALLSFLAYTTMTLWIIITMNGSSLPDLRNLPVSTAVTIYKIRYVMDIMYPVNQAFAKMSLLALYHRLFSINPVFMRWVWATVVMNGCWFVAIFCAWCFKCVPVATAWEMPSLLSSSTQIKSHCINNFALLAAGEALNSAVNFAMIALAVWIVRSLHVSRKTRWRLSFVFALGGASGVIGIIKIGDAYGNIGTSLLRAMWDVLQMAFSMKCCCAPVLGCLLPDWVVLKGLWSRTLGSKAASRGESGAWLPFSRSGGSGGGRSGDGGAKECPPGKGQCYAVVPDTYSLRTRGETHINTVSSDVRGDYGGDKLCPTANTVVVKQIMSTWSVDEYCVTPVSPSGDPHGEAVAPHEVA